MVQAPRAIIGHKLKMLEASRAAEDRRAGRAGSSGTVGEARQQRAKYLVYSHRFKTFFPVRCHAKQVFETVKNSRRRNKATGSALWQEQASATRADTGFASSVKFRLTSRWPSASVVRISARPSLLLI
jgi:hypothetical protein